MRSLMLAALTVGALGLGPACSSADEAQPVDSAQASDDGGGSTRRVEHALGTTDVPADPRRVVALDAGTVLPLLLELGVTVIGAPLPDDIGSTVLLSGDELAGVESMGFPEPSLERVAAARPDMIVGLARTAGDVHGELSRIAPTVLVEDAPSDWRAQSARIADAVNRTEAFEAALAAFDTEVEALRADIGDRRGMTVSVVRALADHVRIHTQHHFAGQVIDEVGLARPEGHRSDDPSVRQVELSLEELSQVDADVIYVFGAGAQGSAGDDVDANLRGLQASPLWAQLGAVQRDAVHVVDPLVWQQGGLPAARLIVADLRSTLLP
jgi:iron complex transport system substrate-binding protein